ncbi:MAG TPA: winged helix-turn-helix domain-containing protein [Gaiellaceae bacterium]
MKGYFRKIPFSSSSPRLTSPAALRALGHPTRLRLLGVLRTEGDATATECAAAVGESPSSCSYHLRTLGRHGFVEEVATSDGRERRWTARVESIDFDAGAHADDEFQAASALARAALLELSDEAIQDYLRHEHQFAPAWREAATFMQTTIVASPAELEELAEEMHALLEPFLARMHGIRPRGSRLVDVSVRAVPRK